MSLGCCFLPSSTRRGETQPTWAILQKSGGGVNAARVHEQLLSPVCVHKGSKAKSYFCFSIPHAQEREEDDHLP